MGKRRGNQDRHQDERLDSQPHHPTHNQRRTNPQTGPDQGEGREQCPTFHPADRRFERLGKTQIPAGVRDEQRHEHGRHAEDPDPHAGRNRVRPELRTLPGSIEAPEIQPDQRRLDDRSGYIECAQEIPDPASEEGRIDDSLFKSFFSK